MHCVLEDVVKQTDNNLLLQRHLEYQPQETLENDWIKKLASCFSLLLLNIKICNNNKKNCV